MGRLFDKVNQFRFDQQPIFERPQFNQDIEIVNEEDVRVAISINICLMLNKLIGSDYNFSKRPPTSPGIPDFTCHLVGSLILVIEAKRKHVLEDMGEQTFPEFYNTSKGKDISKTLPLQSESPPVLKAYAYLTRQAKENPNSPKPQVLVPAQGDNNSRTLRSNSKSSSSSSLTNQASSTFSNQQSSSNVQSVDLLKAPSYVLEEMQKEVEIYKDLADIQGKYIPKLVCYGYYGGGMSFVIGLTIVGSMLSDKKITEQQKTRAIKGIGSNPQTWHPP
ncbi:kinase-like domain-containing protein [Rhizophagus irregularis DAOM 181602=DAOM 197198]|nr:kinase-like domain-containing protein [Rhizophagus irregularis DAOM 181602=DAOM 197198]